MHQKQLHGIYKQNGNAYNMMHTDGLFNSKMEELQQLLKDSRWGQSRCLRYQFHHEEYVTLYD
ncbi:hypothetical protein Leryth_026562 [Lithospermum erythrorhizon]|nr:hypothetical protein Leryth_026562 [Lithospermum erythrorhizon]